MSGPGHGSLRIVHCLRAPVGGLWRHVRDLAGEQARLGHQVGIICDASTGGERAAAQLSELEPACSLGIHRLAMARMPGLGDFNLIRQAHAKLKEIAPDVVHGHGAKGGLLARALPVETRLGARAVTAYTPHGGSLHFRPGSLQGLVFLAVERLLEKRTDVLLFESAYARDAFAKRVSEPGCHVAVVHNGVRDSEFEPVTLDEDASDLMFIGELRQVKGIDVLIAALELLGQRGDTPTLTIVGDGPDEAALRRQAEPLGDQVRFVGAEDARRAFARAPAVVIPSRAESLPYVVLEAAAAERPIIATRVGGIHEIFGPDATRLIPAGDTSALAEAISRLIGEPEDAKALAARLRARVHTDFSVLAMARGALEAYEQARANPG